MRKTNLFGATFLALTAGAWNMAAVAQSAAPAPMASPAPAAPMSAPAAAPMAPAAPAPDATPAPAAAPDAPPATDSAKPMKKHTMHHAMSHKGKLAPTRAGNAAVENLNDASLNAAKSGKPFVAPATPDAAKKTAHMGDKGTAPMHHHMHKAKMTKPATDAATPAPAADSSAPAAAPDATPK